MRYFFDIRNDGNLAMDCIGLELSDSKAAAVEAPACLRKGPKIYFSGALEKELSIDIRDSFGVVAMAVTLILQQKSSLKPFQKL